MMKRGLAFFFGVVALGALLFGGWKWFAGKRGKWDSSNFRPNEGVTSVKKYNRLGETKSPYLLQHKENPVHWFPWGEEAFQAAREENKLIFLSIGYSTCYWCHMMEKDSFEIQEVADVLNKHYVSIKVDREEHPDVDQIYMDAVVGLTGSGGWPLSLFLTPDLKPFTGGTFFWRTQFLQVLNRIQEVWQKDTENILESSKKVTAFLQERNTGANPADYSEDLLKEAYRQWEKNFDSVHGGFGGAPKFPPSATISLLLRIHRRTDSAKALEMAEKTLSAMARGGLFDHLGGGFHRYSTDEKWLTPHFEKMLYDNALLAWSYLEAYQATKNEMYAEVARQTLDYVLREMTDTGGGFHSAEDAGEVEKEGEYYVWTEKELKASLSEDEFLAFAKFYGVSPEGNFENGTNILHIPEPHKWETKKNALIQSARDKLFQIRKNRMPPHRDDKILGSWNGLMIAAFAKGHQVLGEERYLNAARGCAEFLKGTLWKDGILLRRYRDGEAKFSGTLEDYSFLNHGLLSLYESDFDRQWVDWAIELQAKQDSLFLDESGGGYFMSDPFDASLVVRKKEFSDGALPSGNSVTALNLLRLHALTFDQEYLKRAERLLKILAGEAARYPAGFAQALIAVDFKLDRSKEIAVVGKEEEEAFGKAKRFLRQSFLPNKMIAFGPPSKLGDEKVLPILQGKQMLQQETTIYVCEGNVCKAPTSDLDKAYHLINNIKKYTL